MVNVVVCACSYLVVWTNIVGNVYSLLEMCVVYVINMQYVCVPRCTWFPWDITCVMRQNCHLRQSLFPKLSQCTKQNVESVTSQVQRALIDKDDTFFCPAQRLSIESCDTQNPLHVSQRGRDYLSQKCMQCKKDYVAKVKLSHGDSQTMMQWEHV